MAVLSFVGGGFLVALTTWLCFAAGSRGSGLSWETVAKLDAIFADAGFGENFGTRGFYINTVGLTSLGAGLLVGGIGEVLQSDVINLVAIGLFFCFGLIELVAVIVVRKGMPRVWIPEPFRDLNEPRG